MGAIAVVVKEARQLTPSIRELVLEAADGAPLPPWTPGAHIEVDVALPGGESSRDRTGSPAFVCARRSL